MLSKEPIFHIEVEVSDPIRYGVTPYGERRVVPILSGHVSGPRLSGKIQPGNDTQIIRTDGVTDLTARYTIETEAGGLILVASDGLRHGPPEVLDAIARGEDVDPAHYYFRSVMRFETADPASAWLNRIIAIARGRRDKNAVKLDIYEVL